MPGLETETQTLDDAWADFRRRTSTTRGAIHQLNQQSAAGATVRARYTDLRILIQQTLDAWAATLAATGGLQGYVRDQIGDQTIDLQARYISARDALITLRDWIDANIPTGAGGAVLERTVDGTQLQFTTAQTAQFRVEAAAAITGITGQ